MHALLESLGFGSKPQIKPVGFRDDTCPMGLWPVAFSLMEPSRSLNSSLDVEAWTSRPQLRRRVRNRTKNTQCLVGCFVVVSFSHFDWVTWAGSGRATAHCRGRIAGDRVCRVPIYAVNASGTGNPSLKALLPRAQPTTLIAPAFLHPALSTGSCHRQRFLP